METKQYTNANEQAIDIRKEYPDLFKPDPNLKLPPDFIPYVNQYLKDKEIYDNSVFAQTYLAKWFSPRNVRIGYYGTYKGFINRMQQKQEYIRKHIVEV